MELRPHEEQNRRSWDAYSDEYQGRHGEQLTPTGDLSWGTYDIPETELRILGDVADKDILEFGFGSAPDRSASTCPSVSSSTLAG